MDSNTSLLNKGFSRLVVFVLAQCFVLWSLTRYTRINARRVVRSELRLANTGITGDPAPLRS